jgi:hypothetical protein
MLGSITPLGERARNMRWSITVSAFVAGALAGGASVGAALGALGALAGPLVPGGGRAALAALALALGAGLAVDLGLAGLRLPTPRRQVDERWLVRYRGWAYGAGFGLQLGAGVTTIVTTSTVYAALLAALLCGSPAGGLAIGAVFGGVRGAAALPAGRVRSVASLVALDSRLRAWDGPTRRATLALEAAVAIAAAALVAA